VVSNVLGFGVSVKSSESEAAMKLKRVEQEEDALVAEMLSLVGQKA